MSDHFAVRAPSYKHLVQRSSHDPAKLADAFYDSLEGLLHDLRMVTMVRAPSATARPHVG